MIVKEAVILNPSGLHARPAATFVAAAGKFSSKIRIRNLDTNSGPVNAKSILMLLSLAMGRGVRVELSADGPDEAEAMETLVGLIKSGCGEELQPEA